MALCWCYPATRTSTWVVGNDCTAGCRGIWWFIERRVEYAVVDEIDTLRRDHGNCPSFVQAWVCLSWLVERSRAYRSFRLKFLSVRPSWTKIKPSEIWRKCNQRRREPANLYQCRKDDWTTSKATPGKIGHEWKPKSSQQQRSAIIVKKQEEANIERVGSQNRPHWKQLHCWSWRRDE